MSMFERDPGSRMADGTTGDGTVRCVRLELSRIEQNRCIGRTITITIEGGPKKRMQTLELAK